MQPYEGSVKPTSIEQVEHIEVNGVPAKRVLMSGYTGTEISDVKVNDSGEVYVVDESSAILRKILKVLESNQIVDNKQRQRVVVEAIGTNNAPASTEINATLPVTATGAYAIPAIPAAIATSIAISESPVDQRWRVAEDSHISYQSGIRSHLAFT